MTASRTQAIVGVNTFVSAASEPLKVRSIDNEAIASEQVARLRAVKAARDAAAVDAALLALREAARAINDGVTDAGNLLELAVNAARARATLGEVRWLLGAAALQALSHATLGLRMQITAALESVFGRHRPRSDVSSGVYAEQMGDADERANLALAQADAFTAERGRRPRILIAKMVRGQEFGGRELGDEGCAEHAAKTNDHPP